MSAPLSKLQKRLLSRLAARGFKRECALARGRGESPDSSWRASNIWRHEHVALACGKVGLRCCGQDDYKLVEAHFLHLIGEDGRALNALVRHQGQPRSTAEAVLWVELKKAADVGITRDYISSICRSQFRCSLLEASEKNLWNLVYTIRTRAAARRRKLRRGSTLDAQTDDELVSCSVCKRKNFTPAGLKRHICRPGDMRRNYE